MDGVGIKSSICYPETCSEIQFQLDNLLLIYRKQHFL